MRAQYYENTPEIQELEKIHDISIAIWTEEYTDGTNWLWQKIW